MGNLMVRGVSTGKEGVTVIMGSFLTVTAKAKAPTLMRAAACMSVTM